MCLSSFLSKYILNISHTSQEGFPRSGTKLQVVGVVMREGSARENLDLEKTSRMFHPNIWTDPGIQLWDPEKDSVRWHFTGKSGD